jgi:uncharacterized protein
LRGPHRLRLDREGRWLHDGEPIEHPRIVEALHRWIDRDEAGRWVLRAGSECCGFEVDDTAYFVRRVRLEDGPAGRRCLLELSDGTQEALAPGSLRQGEENVLYCDVKGGRFAARFDRDPYWRLGQQVEFDGEVPVLALEGRRWPIRRGAGPGGGFGEDAG